MTSLMCVRAYHRSTVESCAASAMCSRYARTDGVTISSHCVRLESPIARDDVQAAREPLDVPFPRAGNRLVEVVDVEHEAAFGRRELPEVGDVRVTTGLHPQPGDGRRGEVHRHDRGRTSEERER